MLNLTLHCGSQEVNRLDVSQAPTPAPTPTWYPVAHHQLLTQVETAICGSHLKVVNEAHALSADRMRYFALMELAEGHNGSDGYHLVLGLRNSHDKSFPAAIAIGSGVFVCDNLAFSGEVTLARRHTRFIQRDLPQLVNRAFGQLGDMRDHQEKRIEAYRNTNLSEQAVHDLTIRALDSRVVPVTQIPKVLDHWRQPRHIEHEQDGKTAWRYFNAVTETLKGRCLDELPRRTQCLHALLDQWCGLSRLSAESLN